ncbi:MAG TPA: TonB-dependent receptor plug domain-containing protein, partial [Gemmatimonadales bacterium]|nr:TonB-dependent receptor plug domain-containing protein [Gemmatimonadales bacterium]
MMLPIHGRVVLLASFCLIRPQVAAAQRPDTTGRPADSLKVYTLPPAVVSVTRANPPINRIPQAVQLVEKQDISRARPTWGLDEALVTVPGVYAANRYNFSLDQRISIRGFGA